MVYTKFTGKADCQGAIEWDSFVVSVLEYNFVCWVFKGVIFEEIERVVDLLTVHRKLVDQLSKLVGPFLCHGVKVTKASVTNSHVHLVDLMTNTHTS